MHERNVGGLWCHEVLGHLDVFVEGNLDPRTLSAVHTHVGSCDACAAFGVAYSRLVQGLRAVPEAELDAARLSRLRRVLQDAS